MNSAWSIISIIEHLLLSISRNLSLKTAWHIILQKLYKTHMLETLLRDGKEDLSKWRDIPCSWKGSLYTVKTSIL